MSVTHNPGPTTATPPSGTLRQFVLYFLRRVDFNVRFHWIPVIGDDVFLVWNSGYTTYPQAPYRFPDMRSLARPLNGAFVVKVVHRLAP